MRFSATVLTNITISHMSISWFFFFKQKTAYEMRISDLSSDVCSSDLRELRDAQGPRRIGRARKIQGVSEGHGGQSPRPGQLQEFQARVRIADRGRRAGAWRRRQRARQPDDRVQPAQ